ncbi:unnamed protein product [Caenorhabditis auriculariae]|uniref:Uncharacterized protein n=1 Tax=Caenorhabditis auriculariae TaxID=2777116 RepID=A0A8S1HHP4_9PELO|nr:unnamed protein product [Caenorhabditis auriculariae]
MKSSPRSHVVINMKTTIMTQGGHNGVIFHSAVQSTPSTSAGNAWNWQQTRFPPPEPSLLALGPSAELNLSQSEIRSPMPIQTLASTSHETLDSGPYSPISRPLRHRDSSLPPLVQLPLRPLSPVYSFRGRDSPPDEFIEPTKLVLNVFKPPPQYDRAVVRDEGLPLLPDAFTSASSLEVFRVPSQNTIPTVTEAPNRSTSYNNWTRTETLLNDPTPIASKGVQWKERLVEGVSRTAEIDRFRAYESSTSEGLRLNSLYERDFHETEVQNPSSSNVRRLPVTESQSVLPERSETLMRPTAGSPDSLLSALRPYSSISNLAQRTPNYEENLFREQRPLSPLYIIPDRKRYADTELERRTQLETVRRNEAFQKPRRHAQGYTEERSE